MDNNLLELMKYIANNLQTENSFLTPQPTTSVEVVGLLDKIAELRGVSKEKNGNEFNIIMDNKKN